MNEHPPPHAEIAPSVSAFQQLARDTRYLAGGRRSLGSHVHRLRSEIVGLRADRVGWKWIAEEIRKARGDADTIGYTGSVRAAYVRAPDRDLDEFDEAGFLRQVQATLHNAAGKRTLSDQVRRLTAEIAAARAAGVAWSWLAGQLADARGHHGEVGTFSVQLRSLHHRLKVAPRPATVTSSMAADGMPRTPAPQPLSRATPPHVAAVAPPRPVIAPAERAAGATDRIRARGRKLSF